jgi:hypothetical protein
MAIDQHVRAKAYARFLSQALEETQDSEEALQVASLAMEIVDNDPDLIGTGQSEETPVIPEQEPIDAYFSWDIFSRKAQGVLNRALDAAKSISAKARKELVDAINLENPAEMARAVAGFIESYRFKLATLLGTTQLAALLEGAKQVVKDIPEIPIMGGPLPPTLDLSEAKGLLDSLKDMSEMERAEKLLTLPAAEQAFLNRVLPLIGQRPPMPPLIYEVPQIEGEPEIRFPIIDEAVNELSTKNVMTRPEFDALDAAARQKAFTVAHVESYDTLTKIRDVMAENVAEGADYETFKKKILDAVDEGTFMSEWHLETIFRTNVQSAYSDGQMKVLSHPFIRSGFPFVQWAAIHDDRVRLEHLAMETNGIEGGAVYYIDDPTFQGWRPPADFNCFLPGTEVQGDFILGLRSWYSGEVVEITTRSGKSLTVTANHPILTVQGFAPAKSLCDGDDILCYESGIEDIFDTEGWREPGLHPFWSDKPRLSSPNENKHNTPAVIEKVFGALGNFCTDARVPIRANDLHGDAMFGNGYVDVVGPLWELLLNSTENFTEAARQLILSPMNRTEISKSGLCSHDLRTEWLRNSNLTSVKFSKSPFSFTLVDKGPLRSLRFGMAANINASRYQSTPHSGTANSERERELQNGFSVKVSPHDCFHVGNDNFNSGISTKSHGLAILSDRYSRTTQSSRKTIYTDAAFATELTERFATVVTVDPIIQIRKYDWSGHVYDLQSKGGFIVSNNIFTSNCRCSAFVMTVRQAAEKGVKPAVEWMETGQQPEKVFVPFVPPPNPNFKRAVIGAPLSVKLSFETMDSPMLAGYFSFFDAAKHPRGQPDNAGQFGKGGNPGNPSANGQTSPETTPEAPKGIAEMDLEDGKAKHASILRKYGAKVSHAVDTIPVVGFVKKKMAAAMGMIHQKAAERYGPRNAKLIMASGTVMDFALMGAGVAISGVPIISGANQILGLVPAFLLSEAWHQLGGKQFAVEGEERHLSDAEFEEACKHVGNLITAAFRSVLHSLGSQGAKFSAELSVRHAPKGGVTIGGKEYPGGEFIPSGVWAKATAEEKQKVMGGKPHEKTLIGNAPLKIKETKTKAFQGEPIPIKNQISKQEAGKIGEDAVIAWLHSQGLKDARHLNLDRNNFPIDLVQDHAVIEVKTGNVANGSGAQQWRLTIGEPGKAEKEWLAKASDEEKAAWNQRKQKMIHERKKKALADLSKELGKPIKAKTITCLINPDTKTIDIYVFDGWHDRIGWKSELAAKSYKTSISYA